MNILILTPVHPVQIAEMIDFISDYYVDENDIFSVQSMALLGEEIYQDRDKSYLPLMYTFASAVRSDATLTIHKEKKNRRNIIIYGNLDRNTNMKFDHIFAYSGMDNKPEEDRFDPYLDESKNLFDKEFESQHIKPIDWYTIDDAHHKFPTIHHLGVMLKTLGVKKVVDDELQRETTPSD